MDWRLQKRIESLEWLTRLVERIMEPSQSEFKESYQHIQVNHLPYIIYNSQWCRVKFSVTPGEIGSNSGIQVSYGRLHAPDNGSNIIWNGQECISWHLGHEALNFLDGLTPQEAIDQIQIKHQWPKAMEIYRKEMNQEKPEWVLEMNKSIWKTYGQSLFELFDLRRSDLWEQYRKFLKEYYDIKGRSPKIKPSLDQVC